MSNFVNSYGSIEKLSEKLKFSEGIRGKDVYRTLLQYKESYIFL